VTGKQSLNSGAAVILFVAAYFGLTLARNTELLPQSWSIFPVVEAAWLNFLVVLAMIFWMRAVKIPLAHIGLEAFKPSRRLLVLVVATMVVDSLVVGVATPILSNMFGDARQVARFTDVPGNLPLLLTILPVIWLMAAFGEEIFFRGFLMTAIAEFLGSSRLAWIAAVVAQAIAFGAVHAYQGTAQAISVGIGGAVYGAAVLLAKRSLWPVIFAHGINDTVGFILLYAGALEP
jgi:membrane protease YdiL (CAAX protease family)